MIYGLGSVPEWLSTPVVGAVIAALGYTGKLIVEVLAKRRRQQDERRSKLATLHSLLLASRAVYLIQNELVRKFCEDVRVSEADAEWGFDEILAQTYPRLEARLKLQHGLIRAYTMDAMRPINFEILRWLENDTFFKGQSRSATGGVFAGKLQKLEAHLLLWRAKYEFWIPNKPERAIVYMDDESKHGVGFPKGIEDQCATLISSNNC